MTTSHPVLQSLSPFAPLDSRTRFSMRCELTPEEQKAADDKAAADKEAADKKAAEDAKNDPKPGTAEHRVKMALKAKEDAETALEKERGEKQKLLDEKKKSEEDKLKADGKKDELIALKEKELATANDALKQAQNDLDTKGKALTDAEKEADAEVQEAMKAIKDEKKKGTIESALKGKSAFEQRKLLPGLLEMAGVKTSKSLGAGLPGTGSEGSTKIEEDEAAYRVLLEKSQKAARGGDKLTPLESKQFRELGTKLSAARDADRKKKAADDKDKEQVIY